MGLETLKHDKNPVMNCSIKDDTGLNDFQKLPNNNGIAIPRVGIERFRLPLTFETFKGEKQGHDTHASMFVYLDGHKTGVNMSRFCAILQDQASRSTVNEDFFKTMLTRYRTELRDYDHEPLIPHAQMELSFSYACKQPSLKSENWGWQYYDCKLKGEQNKNGETLMTLTLGYEYSSTCPCSLSMSKQYESDYKTGKTTEGNGIAAAHGQRSLATCEVTYKAEQALHIEEVIQLLRQTIPTETQSLVKRQDEQAFAILNGENPMFVEHVSRRLSQAFENEKRILGWKAKIEHFESLHSHNAVAYIQGGQS